MLYLPTFIIKKIYLSINAVYILKQDINVFD